MSGRLSNVDNSHPFYGSSNQGMVTGCTGGAIGPNGSCAGIKQARGIVGNQRGGATAPDAEGNYPTAAGQKAAAKRGIKSFLAVNSGGQSVQSGGYGFTGKNAVLRQNAAPPVVSYDNCKATSPSFKMGAGKPYTSASALKQVGGARNPLAPTASDFYNQSTSVGYGYKSGGDNLLFAGSGYPKETPTTSINTCQKGGRKKKSRSKHPKKRQASRTRKGRLDFVTHKGNKAYNRSGHRQYRRRKPYTKKRKHYHHPKKRQASRTRKGHLDFVTHKGNKAYNRSGHRQYRRRKPYTKKRRQRRGGFLCGLSTHYSHPKKGQASRTRLGRKDFVTHKGDKDFNARGRRQKRARTPYTKKKGGKRRARRQRGGARYEQYQSNVPLTYTMQTPNGPQGGSWMGQLATPPTYKILNNCQDNYNHYKPK